MQVTRAAAKVLKEAVRQSETPDEAGVRFVPRPDTSGALALKISPEPEAGDQVIEESGLRLFLPSDVADALTDQTLDVDASSDGIALALRATG